MVEDEDEDEGETSSSTEDPNINYRDVDDDGMDVEDNGVRHCKSDPWRTNFLIGSIPNITSNRTVKRNHYSTAYVRHYLSVPSPDFASLIVLICNRSVSAADPPCVSGGGGGWASKEEVGGRIVQCLGEDEDVVKMPKSCHQIVINC